MSVDQHILNEITNTLEDDATNYTVFLRAYRRACLEGHPGYPVFWDFAFLFVSNSNATILIGSSSD